MIRSVQPTFVTVPPPPSHPRPVTWWWFLVPLFTCGMATFIMVLIGGVRLRSKTHVAAAIAYFLLTVYFFVGVQYVPSNGGSLPDAAVMPAFLVVWLGGIAHVLLLQTRVRGRALDTLGTPRPLPATDPALAHAQWRLARRQEARQVLATNPALGAELRIGRPDLPRRYDDGGLVDVNHVTAAILTAELDISPNTAAIIVAERDRVGGFSGPDELLVYCDGLTPDRLQIIRERLVFVPL